MSEKNLKDFFNSSLFETAMYPKQGAIWPEDWKNILGALLLYKLLIAAIVILILGLIPDMFDLQAWYGNFHYPPGTEPTVISRLTTWDAQHYLYLSYEGTPGPEHPSAAFAQGWPRVIRLGGLLTGGNHALAGLLLANVFSLLAFVLLFQFIRLHFSAQAAYMALVLMIAYPGSLFYSAMYAESLFLLLNVLFFAFLYQDKFARSALFALVQPLVRAVGVVTVVPFVFHQFTNWRRKKCSARAFLWCLAPLLGWGGAYLLMYLLTGDALTGAEASKLYKAQSSWWHLVDPIRFIQETFAVRHFHSYLGSFVDRIWIIPLAYGLFILWRKDKALFLYSLALVCISTMITSYASTTRYLCVVFPIFIAYGVLFEEKRKNYLFLVSALFLFAFQVLFIIRYLNNIWVG